ncbi:MAG: hypothetical protein IJR13_00905, partial [Bacteroidales bacterium]|nr:hypothetical protein [Bacteroidales bacterium]
MKKSKKLLVLIWSLLVAVCAFAQVPQRVSYQAVVRHANNRLATSETVSVRLSILYGSPDGVTVYREVHTVTTNQNGLVAVFLGEGTPSRRARMSDIDWSNGPYFLKSEIDPDGGSDFSSSSISQIASVPYALYSDKTRLAERAEKVDGLADSIRTALVRVATPSASGTTVYDSVRSLLTSVFYDTVHNAVYQSVYDNINQTVVTAVYDTVHSIVNREVYDSVLTLISAETGDLQTAINGKLDTTVFNSYRNSISSIIEGKADVETVRTQIHDSISVINANLAKKVDASDLDNYATKAKVNADSVALAAAIAGKADATDLDNYAAKSKVNADSVALATAIAGKADATDLDNYATKAKVNADSVALAAAINGKTDIAEVAGAIHDSISGINAAVEGKADMTDVAAAIHDTVTIINSRIDGKADVVDLDNYATKAKVNADSVALATAINGKTDITEVAGAIHDSISGINAAVEGKADMNDVAAAIHDTVTIINSRIDSKADAADLDNYATKAKVNADSVALATAINGKTDITEVAGAIHDSISGINAAVEGKADMNDVAAAIHDTVTIINSRIDGKADMNDVAAAIHDTVTIINSRIDSKADMNDVAAAIHDTVTIINSRIDGKADASELNNYATKAKVNADSVALATAINGKTDITEVAGAIHDSISGINAAVEGKADMSDVAAAIHDTVTIINSRIDGKADATDLDDYATKAKVNA